MPQAIMFGLFFSRRAAIKSRHLIYAAYKYIRTDGSRLERERVRVSSSSPESFLQTVHQNKETDSPNPVLQLGA